MQTGRIRTACDLIHAGNIGIGPSGQSVVGRQAELVVLRAARGAHRTGGRVVDALHAAAGGVGIRATDRQGWCEVPRQVHFGCVEY